MLLIQGMLTALPGCSATENSGKPEAAFERTVKKQLGTQYVVSYNTTKTHALCQQTRSEDHSQRNFRYIVIKLSNNKVIHEGLFRMGYVRWVNDQSIEVLNSSVSRKDEKANDKKIININSDQL
jgi:hypothetical protein